MTHPDRRDDITTGELARRIESAVQVLGGSLEALRKEIVALGTRVESTYLRQDLASAFRITDQAYIAKVQNDLQDLDKELRITQDQRRTDRRLMWTSLVAPLLILGITLLLSSLKVG